MNIGITYDLRSEYLRDGHGEEETAELDREDTIQSIENALNNMGFTTERIGNVKSLLRYLAQDKTWDMVFNICEGIYGFGREAQVPAILEAYQIPYTFSDPLVLSLTLHKGMTKRIVRDLGIATSNFAVIEEEKDLHNIELSYPLFAKPVAEGSSKGIDQFSITSSIDELSVVCKKLLTRYRQPVLVEEFLPGREFTVGIIGTKKLARAIGVMEIVLKNRAHKYTYSYDNKQDYENCVEYKLVVDPEIKRKCEDIALRSWIGLGCRDGGRVDLKMDKAGQPNLIEVNPLAGLNPVYSDLCIIACLKRMPYQNIIEEIMESALKRVGKCKCKIKHS